MRLIWLAAASVVVASTLSAASVAQITDPDAVRVANSIDTSQATAYLPEAMRSDQFEIQASQIALSRAISPQLKDFAAGAIRDHTDSAEWIRDAERKAGMTPLTPPPLDAERARRLQELRDARPAAFDRIYLGQQRAEHELALALQNGYAQFGDTPELREVAGRLAPILRLHFTMLQNMAVS